MARKLPSARSFGGALLATVTDLATKVSKSGDTMTGNLVLRDFDGLKVTTVQNLVVQGRAENLGFAPVMAGPAMWHDLLAFNNNRYIRIYETSADNGATWTPAVIEERLFIGKEAQSIGPGGGFSLNAVGKKARWTWHDVGSTGPGLAYSGATWLVINWAYDLPIERSILFESSLDGTTWTTRHTSTYTMSNMVSYHHLWNLQGSGDRYYRLTVSFLSAASGTPFLRFSGIRIMSNRAGDQGSGREAEFPYIWDSTKRIGIGMSIFDSISAMLHVKGDARIEGRITNVSNPTGAQDVGTKAYIDAADTSLQTKISTETSQRQAGDAGLQSQLDALNSGQPTVETLTPTGGVYVPTGNAEVVKINPDAVFTIGAPVGTLYDGKRMRLRIKADATNRAITWNTVFQNSGVASLPSTAIASKTHNLLFEYDLTAAKWVLLAVDPSGW
jgi:hypothetical protein